MSPIFRRPGVLPGCPRLEGTGVRRERGPGEFCATRHPDHPADARPGPRGGGTRTGYRVRDPVQSSRPSRRVRGDRFPEPLSHPSGQAQAPAISPPPGDEPAPARRASGLVVRAASLGGSGFATQLAPDLIGDPGPDAADSLADYVATAEPVGDRSRLIQELRRDPEGEVRLDFC
jgi:hypothetical protein